MAITLVRNITLLITVLLGFKVLETLGPNIPKLLASLQPHFLDLISQLVEHPFLSVGCSETIDSRPIRLRLHLVLKKVNISSNFVVSVVFIKLLL